MSESIGKSNRASFVKDAVIDGKQLFQAVFAGFKELLLERDLLNRINVFPVADGDTGTNLAYTLRAVVDNSTVSDSAGKTAQSMAEAALMGARGNSGLIMAQFMNGLSEGIGNAFTLDTSNFSEAVQLASEKARRAMAKPVEGTMITVIKEWADHCITYGKKVKNFKDLLSHSLEAAYDSLRETPKKLKALKDAGVVDAGAKGFVAFLQGMARFFKGGVIDFPKMEPITITFSEEGHQGEANFRYCTEVLLRGEELPLEQLQEELEELGDSVIVAGSKTLTRIHVHTDSPADVVEYTRQSGTIVKQKVEDMKLQWEVLHKKKHSIALVTDSACDLPQEIKDAYQIHMIPLRLFRDQLEYLDRVTITPDHFYRLMDEKGEYPKSSQPDPQVIRSMYEFLADHYDSIISVHISKALSGTWSVCKNMADQVMEEKNTRISVVDSKTLSGALGLQVLETAKDIEAGKNHEEIISSIERRKKETKLFVSVATLKYMVRGGRVSPLKGFMAKLLNLKPIVSINTEGKSEIFGKAFNRRTVKKCIFNVISERHAKKPVSEYAIVHADAEDLAFEFADEAEKIIGYPPTYIMHISPIIALNAGKRAVAIVTV